jgi:hypothetical protein
MHDLLYLASFICMFLRLISWISNLYLFMFFDSNEGLSECTMLAVTIVKDCGDDT